VTRRNLVPRYTVLTLGYAFLVQAAFALALALRFDAAVVEREWLAYRSLAPALTLLSLAGFLIAGLYHGLWRYAGTVTLFQIFKGVSLSALALLGLLLARPETSLSLGFVALFWVSEMALLGGARLGWRLWREGALADPDTSRGPGGPVERALVVGAGAAGVSLIQQMRRGPASRRAFAPVGFVDEDPRLRGKQIEGVRVLGTLADLPRLVGGRIADVVVLSDPESPAALVRQIARVCDAAGVRVKALSGLVDPGRAASSLARVRDVSIEDLLGRRPVQIDLAAIRGFLRGQRVLVTGAGGSIGSELARQAAGFEPEAIGLLDHAENGLFYLQHELAASRPEQAIDPIVADLLDPEGLEEAFKRFRPTVVFHAAAHKHVPLLEANPREAVLNNVIGTHHLMRAAERHGVGKLVLISTDKAVRPSSVMGATKRVCEMMLQARAPHSRTRLLAVRFGNVLGSEGSVIPLFQRQIARGGPVTVTHPDARRFFMTAGEAARLVMQAAAMGHGGELFLLDMGEQVRILDLARQLVKLAGLREGVDIEITFTGLRPGEKLFEELHTASEHARATRHERILMWDADPIDEAGLDREMHELEAAARRGDGAAIRKRLEGMVPDYREAQTPAPRGASAPVVELPAGAGSAGPARPGPERTVPGPVAPGPPPVARRPAPPDAVPAAERAATPTPVGGGTPDRRALPLPGTAARAAAAATPPIYRRAADGAGPNARRPETLRPFTSDAVIAGALLVLSYPLWVLVWLEARRARRRDWLEQRVCVGRSRRTESRRDRRTPGGPERRGHERRAVDLMGAPLYCERFRADLGPLSRWLARRGLDRLPMLRNVVRGEMALVGPSPVSQGLVGRWSDLVPGIEKRFRVPPGVTGLAQLSGDADEDTGSLVRRAALDLEYVWRRSSWLDLVILARTVWHVLMPREPDRAPARAVEAVPPPRRIVPAPHPEADSSSSADPARSASTRRAARRRSP